MEPQRSFPINNVSIRTGRRIPDEEYAGEEEPYEESPKYSGSPTDIASEFESRYESQGLQPSVGSRPTIEYKNTKPRASSKNSRVSSRSRQLTSNGIKAQKGDSSNPRAVPSLKRGTSPNQVKAFWVTMSRKFSAEGENLEKGDITLLLKNTPTEPSFPFIMVTLAVIKDILDIPGELSIIGIVATTILSVFISLILLFWCLGKLSGGWWKKKIIGWLWTRYIFAVLIEFLPFMKMIPATTIFILMAHNKEKKIVKLLNFALEAFHDAGLTKHIK